jgi:hypothetical protein
VIPYRGNELVRTISLLGGGQTADCSEAADNKLEDTCYLCRELRHRARESLFALANKNSAEGVDRPRHFSKGVERSEVSRLRRWVY